MLGANPSALMGRIVQSLPSVFGAGAAARMFLPKAIAGAKAAGLSGAEAEAFIAKKVIGYASAAEGAMAAGSIAEQGRQSGREWSDFAAPAAAGGAITAAVGRGSGAIGRKLGIGDIESDIAGGAVRSGGTGTWRDKFVPRVLLEGTKEGLFEETPQSLNEAIMGNLATGEPWGKGVGAQTAEGTLAGLGMGAGHAALFSAPKPADILNAPTIDSAIDTATKALDSASLGPAIAAYDDLIGQQRQVRDANQQALLGDEDFSPGVVQPASGFANRFPPEPPRALTYHPTAGQMVVFPDGSAMTRAEYEQRKAQQEQSRLDGMVQDAPLPGMMQRAVEQSAPVADAMELNALVRDERADKNARLKAEMERLKASRKATPAALPSEASAPAPVIQQQQAAQPSAQPAMTPLQQQYDAARAAGDTATMRLLAPQINAEKQRNTQATAERQKPAVAFAIGQTPANAEPITVRNGVVYQGEYALEDYETGKPITVPEGATHAQIRKAMEDAGQVPKGFNFFGEVKSADAVAAAPDQTVPVAQPATSGEFKGEKWSITPYRYAKNSVVMRVDRGDGYKGQLARVVEALGGRHVNRAKGYVLSESKARKALEMVEQGYDANAFTGKMEAPKQAAVADTKSGVFGEIFRGYENNPEGAIEKLLEEKRGEVADAYIHPEIGAIAFVYGDEKMGLRHILEKRGRDFLRRIPELLRTGTVTPDEKGLPRTYIVDSHDPAHVAVVRLEWDKQQKTWLMTAYTDEEGKFAGGGKTADTPAALASEVPATDGVVFSRASGTQNITNPRPEGKIEDFGEKIGGARKDVWTSFKDKLAEVSDDEIITQPLSKVWPEPDYQALLDGGADPWAIGFMHAARDEIPRKPGIPWKQKRWAEQVKSLRETAQNILSGDYSTERVQKKLEEWVAKSPQMKKLASRIELYQLVGHGKSLAGISFAEHYYSLYKGKENVYLWVVEQDAKASAFSNWPREIVTADTKTELLQLFKDKYASLDLGTTKKKEVQFDIYSRKDNGFWIGKKLGRNPIWVAGPFATVGEARAYRDANNAELIAKLEKNKEIPNERRNTNNPRVGEDVRNGQDVTPQMFGDAFGFKGVEFGNWVEQKKRQKDLNDAYDALMDMAAILGVPPKAISLNGELGLAFGARGSGGIGAAAAHYEQDKVVINLTKKEGAGSLGHEWWHALDNYFQRMRSKGEYATEALDVSLASRGSEFVANTAVRKEMVAAFGEVVKAIRMTALKARSSKLDAKRSKEYWTTGREMSARAFESYLISKLQDQNASNDYLANIVDDETWAAAEKLGFELEDSYPYPTAGEMPLIRGAFEKFFQTIEHEETDKGVRLYSESRATLPVSKAAVREITSPESAEIAKLLGKELPKGGKVGVIADIGMLPSAVEATGIRMSRKTAEAIRFIAQMFGRKVVFYEATHNVPEGINQDGKTLYVNVDSGVDALAVAGHEFTHSLQHTDPEAYQAALDAVKAILAADPARAKSYAAYYGKKGMDADALAAELLSDIGGNLWRDEGFFGEMFAEVQRQHPHAEARSIITRLRDALVAFINKLIAATPKQGFQLEEKGLITREELESIKALIVKMAADAFIAEEKARVGGEVMYQPGRAGEVRNSTNRLASDTEEITLDSAPVISDEDYERLASVFLSDFPPEAGYKNYRRGSHVARAIRNASDAELGRLDGRATTKLLHDVPLGHFSGYESRASIRENQDGGSYLVVELFGKEQREAGLDAEPALKLILDETGELTIKGPDPLGETYQAFEGRGWAEPATDNEGNEYVGWSRLTDVEPRQLIQVLGDTHARAKEWQGAEFVGLHWSRATGATGSKLPRKAAMYFSPPREVDFDATGQFWNDIEAGKTAWSRKEIEDVYAQGRRGTRRTAKNIEGVAGGSTTPDDVARATVVWDESIAGFNGYATSGRRFGKHFVVSVVPELFHKSTDYDSKASVDNSSVVQYVFTPMEDGRYELSVMDPLTGGRAYNNLRLKGRLNETGGRVSVVLDNPYRESRAFLQEAVRRLALSDGAVPVVVEAGREGGARAGSTEEREFSQERIKARFSTPRAQTETPEFKRWFGDSKVVDADGKPLVVYHGTNKDVGEFSADSRSTKTGNPNAQLGFFFSPSAAEASRYAKDWGREGGNVMPVYLSIRKPYEMSFKEFDDMAMAGWRAMQSDPNYDPNEVIKVGDLEGQKRAAAEVRKFEQIAREQAAARREELIAQGYDGIVVRMKAGDEYIAFDPTQIKSATGNNGQFDGNNPDIRYSTPRVQQGETGKPFTLEVTPQDGQRFRDGVTAADEDDAIRFANFLWPNADVRVLAQKAFVPDVRYSTQRAVDELNAQIKEQEGVDKAFSASELGDKQLISAFKQAFGVDLVPIKPNIAEAAGFLGMNFKGRLYVNAEQDKHGFVQLAGHELLHQIANEQPAIYKWFEDQARNFTSPGAERDYRTLLDMAGADPATDAYQEVLADFVGDALADSDFLQALADNNPTKFRMFVRSVIRWLESAANKLAGAGFESSRYVSDVKGLQGYLLGALDSYAKTKEVPRFSTQRIVGASNRQYTQAQQQAFANTGRTVDEKTTLEKLKAFVAKRWQQGIFDQFAPFRQIDMDAYTLMRLSKGSTGAFEALMHHGKLAIRDGAYDADTSGGVMDRLFYQLGKESTDFLYWVAGNRAERLAKEGKENLFSPQDIAAYKSLASGTADFDYTIQTGPGAGKVTRDRTLIYADAQRVMNEFNKNVLDMAEESGLIDGDSRKLWEHEFYVPFYRVMEDDEGSVRGANISKGLVRQEAFKKLKGGTEGLNDLLANTLMNWAHLIDASAKNRAASAAIKAAENVSVARPAVHGEKNTVWYMGMVERKIPAGTEYEENGVVKIAGKDTKIRSIGKVEYKVEDAAVMEAITGLEYAGIRGPIMDILAKPKHWLTIGVTASPFFKVRNLIRDSLQAIGTSDLSKNPIANVVEGMKLTNRQRQEYVSALAGGGLIRFGTMLENNEAARTRQLIKNGAKDGHILDGEPAWRKAYDKWFEPAISAYNELGNRGEEINRMALYDQLRKKDVDHATASLMARDLMDFSLQGSFQTIRFLSQVVPFFNARLQGMYKLGRATKENREQMAFVIFASALAGLGLMALAAGDEDKWKKWKRREEWDKASYWWFEFGGMEFRIPKPFELGAVAHIAERTVEAMFDNERDVGKRWAQAMLDLGKNQLAMNPVPQAFKPIIDLYANKDSFTGRPIETMAMQRLAPTERYTAATSMPARGLSSAIGGALSPVQIDQLVRSYFGWFGATVVGAADMLTRAVNDEPTRPALDYFKFASGGMVKEDETSSRYVTQMYEQAAELEQAYATYNRMRKEGRLDEAKEYAEDNADKLKAYRSVEAVKKQEKQINERIRMIERSELHPAEKRIKIRELKRKQSEIAERLSRQ